MNSNKSKDWNTFVSDKVISKILIGYGLSNLPNDYVKLN